MCVFEGKKRDLGSTHTFSGLVSSLGPPAVLAGTRPVDPCPPRLTAQGVLLPETGCRLGVWLEDVPTPGLLPMNGRPPGVPGPTRSPGALEQPAARGVGIVEPE